MKFNLKNYQTLKTKKYIKKNNLILFSVGANLNSLAWINIEQNLRKLKLNYYKVCNNITKKIIQNSMYKNLLNTINSTFFFYKPIEITLKKVVFKELNELLFSILAIKLNRKIYAHSQLKTLVSLNYKKNVKIIYQFLTTHTKFFF